MNWIKKISVIFLAMLMTAATATGCSSTSGSSSADQSSQKTQVKEIYYLNFKSEDTDELNTIANEYKKLTGITVKVVTAASGTYEQTLKSEIAKSDSPTIFQINGPVGYQNWKDYCADLSGSKLYNVLVNKDLAIRTDDGVFGIPYTVEGYGIIYNDAIMKKYFALPNKKVSVSSTADIKNFATLKAVVEDMTANKDKLGISGVFASTSFASGQDWRWQTHLANLPFYYEFKENQKYKDTEDAGLNTSDIQFKYAANFKNVFDLYINNSCTGKNLLGSKTVADSMAEFALGKVAMVQNGNWAWSQIAKVSGNTVKADDIKFLPIYTGMSGEEKQGICIGTENYFAINSKVSKEKQQASLDFLYWLFSSTQGKKHVTNDLGFLAPFSTFSDDEKPTDPLGRDVLNWEAKTDVENVPWTFESFPSQNFKNEFGAALLQYAQGKENWDQVVSDVKSSWKIEYECNQE
ncbi:ABC transporter substrate-binding protein [Caproicibacter sp.]|uniref:ABC transporter substrate-binding protein n=1 Tax=Caproicibacter sp. TaxID=2814884 RepID=UPI0039896F6F